MADDKNNDLDPEEESNDSFEDDDFGLPDLEYDELDDDEFEDEFGTAEFDESADESVASEIEEAEAEPLEGLDDTSEELENELDSDEFDLSEDELQRELEELESEDLDFSDVEEMDSGIDSTDEEFYEQESFEEFSDDNVLDSVFGDEDEDPDVQAEQVLVSTTLDSSSGPQRDLSAKQKAANQYAQAYADSQKEKGKFARIVIIGTLVILIVASGLWFMYTGGDEPKELAKTEQPRPKPQPKPQVKKETQQQKAETAPEPKPKPVAAPTTTPAGTINELQSRTGNAYIVIASFIDGDLAKDYASMLAANGKSPYIVAPFNNGLYYRVAIAEFQTFDDATQNIGRYKEEFGPDIWTLRY